MNKDCGALEQTKNFEIYNDNITDIKCRWIEWVGHEFRTNHERLPKMVLESKLETKRKIGRPKFRWFDDVLTDLKMVE